MIYAVLLFSDTMGNLIMGKNTSIIQSTTVFNPKAPNGAEPGLAKLEFYWFVNVHGLKMLTGCVQFIFQIHERLKSQL